MSVSNVIFIKKGRSRTKQNEKKRKGFEKELLVAIVRAKNHFRGKGRKNENAMPQGGKTGIGIT